MHRMAKLHLEFEKSKANCGGLLVLLDWFFLLFLNFDRGILVILGLRILFNKNCGRPCQRVMASAPFKCV
jgi:hypothetical protein